MKDEYLDDPCFQAAVTDGATKYLSEANPIVVTRSYHEARAIAMEMERGKNQAFNDVIRNLPEDCTQM